MPRRNDVVWFERHVAKALPASFVFVFEPSNSYFIANISVKSQSCTAKQY